MTAYYNEIDPFAAAWLRELITAGHIAQGKVDERSIEDVVPSDLLGFTQCHFFAGIGVWSYALRQAGWSDDRPVWTGSCPCQPFSAAGKGAGFDDERHLWPAFHHIIRVCRPPVLFGEQVASKDGLAWFDLVQSDLEGADYACGAVDTCAAGFGAPHIRQRLYWVGHIQSRGQRLCISEQDKNERQYRASCGSMRMGDTIGTGLEGFPRNGDRMFRRQEQARAVATPSVPDRMEHPRSIGRGARRDCDREHDGMQPCAEGNTGGVEYANGERCQGERLQHIERDVYSETSRTSETMRPSPTKGFWRAADWLLCRDGKWRAVEPGTFPLAHGAAKRVGRLRGYGNAIVAPQAEAFVKAFMDTYQMEIAP